MSLPKFTDEFKVKYKTRGSGNHLFIGVCVSVDDLGQGFPTFFCSRQPSGLKKIWRHPLLG